MPKSYTDFSIKASLYEGGAAVVKQNGGSECVTASEGLEHAKQERAKAGQSVQLEDDDYMTVRLLSKSEQQSGHPITSSCYIKYIDEFEFAWKRDFYDLYLKNRKNLSLVLELFGTPKGSNDPAQPIGYGLMNINQPKDGKIAYDYFVIKGNQMPVTFDDQQAVELPQMSIGLTILDLAQYKKPLKEQLAEDRNRVDTPQSQKQFIPNDEKQFTFSEGFTKDDIMQISIDGTRHVPDNASVTKICCKVVDQNLKEIHPQTEQVASLEPGSTLRNQRYNLVFNVKMKQPSNCSTWKCTMKKFGIY